MYQSPAPPRRKSCEACKVSKRRCDLTFPACSRCLHRNIPCVYPARQSVASNFDLRIPSANPTIGPDELCMVDPNSPAGIDLLATPSSVPPVTDALCVGPDDVDSQDEIHWQQSSQRIPVQSDFEMTSPRARPPKPLSEIVASRLQFSIDILKDAPRSMVFENQTPWCHPQLYKSFMPRFMQGE